MSGVSAPEVLDEGDEMEFTLWAGPLPIRWRARIAAVTDNGFVDEQIAGPFETWRHQHRFVPDGDCATWVEDSIEARLKHHPIRGPIGLAMWLGLPIVWAYRIKKTRSQLARPA